MFRRMISKDIRSNPTVSITLVVLMMLAVVLATASAGLLVRLAGASAQLLDRADAPHVAQMHAGPVDTERIRDWASENPQVIAQQTDLLLGIDGADLAFDGQSQSGNVQQNSLVVPNTQRDLLLDLEDRPLIAVEPGTVWLPVYYQIEDSLDPGSVVTVTGPDGFSHELTVAGFVRDSIMNTAIASSKRLAVSPTDLETIAAHTGTAEHLISFWLADPDTQIASFRKDYQDDGLPSVGPMVDLAAFGMFNMISEGLVAGVVIFASLLLMVVGLLCLRLSFLTAVQQDRREIGVLTAIGVSPRGIKRIYLYKYGALGAIACLLGLGGGWMLAPVMSASLTRYLGSSGGAGTWLAPLVTAVAVFGIILAFIWLLLRRLNHVSAVDALRSAQPGNATRRARLRLHRSVLPVNISVGLIDLGRRWAMFLLLFFVFAISVFIMVVPMGAASTIRSPQFITYMGVGPSDIRLDLQHADDDTAVLFNESVDALQADPDVAEFAALITTRHEVIGAQGEAVNLYIESGDHEVLPVRYAEGRASTHENEIALSLLALAETGYQVGDSLPVTVGEEIRDLEIVGSYQDITHGGKTAKAVLPADSGATMWYVLAAGLVDGADPETVADQLSARLPGVRVSQIAHYRDQQLGPIATQITLVALLSALTAIALAVLMSMMFTRMLLAGDRGQIAIQRAIGASGRDIRAQYLTRILTVLALGVPAGLLVALTLGEQLFNLMFEVMFGGTAYLFQGTSRIDLTLDPWLTLAIPTVLFIVVAGATALVCRTTTTASLSSLSTE